MMAVWEDEVRRSRKRRLGLPAIVPMVFYTGTRPWRASRNFRELIDAPEIVRSSAPSLDIIYLGLPEAVPEQFEAMGRFGTVLRAVREREADHPDFAGVLAEAARAIRPLLGEEWRELTRFLLGLVHHSRSTDELERLTSVIQTAAVRVSQHREFERMTKTIVHEWLEQGERIGLARGREEGREDALRSVILRLGARNLGPPSAAERARLNAIHDISRLERFMERVLDVSDWSELFTKPVPQRASPRRNGSRNGQRRRVRR